MLSLESAMGDRIYLGKEAVNPPAFSERILGKYGDQSKGATLIITADTLGDEKHGIAAVQNVLRTLSRSKIPLKGQVIGLAGNTSSYRRGLLGELRGSLPLEYTPASQDEYLGYNKAEEFIELIEEFEKIPATDVFYIDIKTSPTLPYPYSCHSRNESCKAFASKFPFYKVMGLEDFITDHLGFYLNAKNYTCNTFKIGTGGPYPATQVHEATIWWALIQCGCLLEDDVPNILHLRNVLDQSLPDDHVRSYEVIFKYTVQEDEYFRMVPGYKSFQKIKAGEVLATSDGASVVSQWDGRIFMPLYHTQSNDGFFILKEIE